MNSSRDTEDKAGSCGTREPLVVTFSEALERTKRNTRHLLLGNGFSIDARESFRYDNLFERASNFSPPVTQLFRELNSTDFEDVLSALSERIAAAGSDAASVSQLREQEREVREAFLTAVSRVHPESSTELHDIEKANCTAFLEHFVGKSRDLGTKKTNFRGKIFTTNYDLLLYWALVKHGKKLNCLDGFENPTHTDEYGVWYPEHVPRLLYLHGALHIYRVGGEHHMLRYYRGQPLIPQTRRRLVNGEFPLFVSEGSPERKRGGMSSSAYLTRARQDFDGALRNTNAALFTFGHGLADRDGHLLRRIGELRIGSVYVGAWEGLSGPAGPQVRAWANRWWDQRDRTGASPLNVFVFDSSKFSVWSRRYR